MKDEYDLEKMKLRPKRAKKIESESFKTMISLRVDSMDLSELKREAIRLGMPYQTLICSILHRYVEGELIDKAEVKKITKMSKR